jgi:voltage-gated potassium channel
VSDAAFESLVPPWLRTASLVAALLTIPVVILDTVQGLPGWLAALAHALNWTVWSVFLVSLLVVLVRAPSPWSALKANPVLPLVVLFTVPFAPAGLQVFRLLRLGALLGAAHHAQRLFSLEGLRYAAIVLVLVVVGGGVVFTAVEHSAQHLSIQDGIWWAIVTVTTVGYGDIVPHTEAGRAVAVVVMITGIGTAALLVGAASQRFLTGSEDDGSEQPSLAELHREIRELRAELAEFRGAGRGT